jgi:hypothetical protein
MSESTQQAQPGENKPLLHTYSNLQDNFVIRTLGTAPIMTLPIDRFGHLISQNSELSNDQRIVALRHALIRAYIAAATDRLNAKATSEQITSANKAVALLTNSLDHLDRVAPPALRGLLAAFGAPTGDTRGLNETNELHLVCWQTKLDVVSLLLRLCEAVERENDKPSKTGERKKRLRTLVERLANWWESTGKSLAPYVIAKRRDEGPAVVLGRQGDFVSLARTVLCEIDNFKATEVVSAITNVHEDRLAKQKAHHNKHT